MIIYPRRLDILCEYLKKKYHNVTKFEFEYAQFSNSFVINITKFHYALYIFRFICR